MTPACIKAQGILNKVVPIIVFHNAKLKTKYNGLNPAEILQHTNNVFHDAYIVTMLDCFPSDEYINWG